MRLTLYAGSFVLSPTRLRVRSTTCGTAATSTRLKSRRDAARTAPWKSCGRWLDTRSGTNDRSTVSWNSANDPMRWSWETAPSGGAYLADISHLRAGPIHADAAPVAEDRSPVAGALVQTSGDRPSPCTERQPLFAPDQSAAQPYPLALDLAGRAS